MDQPTSSDPPADPTGADLPTTPEALLARLAALGIAVTTHQHPAVFTVEESRRLRGELPGGHCKSLFLKDKKGRRFLVVALEESVVALKHLHELLGSGRLSFASAELLWQVLGVRPGSVTPFALVNDTKISVSVFLEERMMAHDILNFHPLINTQTTAIRSADLVTFIGDCGHRPQPIALASVAGA